MTKKIDTKFWYEAIMIEKYISSSKKLSKNEIQQPNNHTKGYHGLEVYTCGGDPLGVGHEAVGEVTAVGQVQAHDPVMGVE